VLYFEDFAVGQQFFSDSYIVTREDAVGFASHYDSQYFHVDEAAAKDSLFGRLVVSGWHTAAISMRLKLRSGLEQVAGGLIGLGLSDVKWPAAVYPGDMLRLVIVIMSARLSASKPGHGIVGYRFDTFNQHDVLVMTARTSVLVQRKIMQEKRRQP